jgi:hypothetical protein
MTRGTLDDEFMGHYRVGRRNKLSPLAVKTMIVHWYIEGGPLPNLLRDKRGPTLEGKCGKPWEPEWDRGEEYRYVEEPPGDWRVTDASMADGRLGHTGWYTRQDASEDDRAIGVVVKLSSVTSRKKRAKGNKWVPTVTHRFLVGYRTADEHGSAICLRVRMFTSDQSVGEFDGDEAMVEAAREADEIARGMAENCIEYDTEWNAVADAVREVEDAIADWRGCEFDSDEREEARDRVRGAIKKLREVEDYAKTHYGISRRDV